MDNDSVNSQEVPTCAKCEEYANEIEAYGIALVVLAFIGPIVGILIGLFARKKLAGK